MRIRLTRDRIISISLLLLGIVAFLSLSIFDLGYRLNTIICVVSFASIFLLTFQDFFRGMSPICSLFLLSFLLVLLRNQDLAKGNIIYVLSYASLLCVMLHYSRCDGIHAITWIKPFYAFMYLFGWISAIGTITFAMVPGLYQSSVLPLTVKTAFYNSLIYCANNGYQPGFALHYSTNGIYLALFTGICFSNYLFCKRNAKRRNLLILIVAAVALLLTAKRAHIVFSLAAGMVVYYLRNIDNKRARFFKTIGIIGVIIIAFMILANYVPAVSAFIERFLTDVEAGSLLSGRNVLYSFALSLFCDDPFLGVGWANFKYLAEAAVGEYNEVHNVYLQILTETGVVGAIVFFSIFGSLTVKSFANFKRSVLKQEEFSVAEQRITATSVFLVVFFLLYCLSGNPLYDMVVWMPVMLYQIAAFHIGGKMSRVEKMV